jgi:phosphoesterase RecJ-like protein
VSHPTEAATRVTLAAEQEQVTGELLAADKLLLTTHENPDGDALGSLLAMHWILEQLGKDSLMFMSPDEFPLPWEYRTWEFDGLVGAPPDDVDERVVVFLDCGNIDRMPVGFLQRGGIHILNIDHHHDNTRFGTVNFVVGDASCTAEIVFALAKDLGAEITPPIADALYVGLVTDTGRFMYENTTPEAHRMAAELIEAGVEPDQVYRRLYEDLPLRRLQLLQRALSSVERHDRGTITVGHLVKGDYEATGALETDSEGIVDHMRAVEGTAVAVLVRELLATDRDGMRKVSLRATDGRVDVSRIARALGGGGHRQAAGFTTELPFRALVDELRRQVRLQLRP